MRLLLALLFILTMEGIQAQTIQLVLSPKPSPYLSDWTSKRETAQIIANNTSASTIDCKIKTQLFVNGSTLYAETKLADMPLISLAPGVQIFGSDEIYPVDAIKFYGNSMNSLVQTGRIPEGYYTLCTSLVNPIDGSQLGTQAPQCKSFQIVHYQAPILLMPLHENNLSEIQAKNGLFKWTAIHPMPGEIVVYQFLVYEVLEGQTPIQALRTNLPIVDMEVNQQTQTLWPANFLPPENNKTYIWTVIPKDQSNRPFLEGTGMAEPFVFNVKPPQMQAMPSAGGYQIGDTIHAGKESEFDVLITSITKNGNKYTGTGKVWIPWMQSTMKVSFVNIQIDSIDRLKKGGIIVERNQSLNTGTMAYPQAWAQSYIAGNAWINNMTDASVQFGNQTITDVAQWVDQQSGMAPLNYTADFSSPVIPGNGLKLPLGLVFSGGAHQLLLTEMIFKPDEAQVNFLVQTQWLDNGIVKKLGFVGSSFNFRKNKVLFSNGKVQLAENIGFSNSNLTVDYLFKKGTAQAGCYINWSDTGLVSLNVEMEAKFTRDWLIPIPSSNATQKVLATFTGSGRNWQDILIQGTLGACEFTQVKGFKIKQSVTAVIDFSDHRNYTNMVFPASYPGDTGVDWRGFYIPFLSLTLPETWTKNNLPVPVSVNHLIIDGMGLSVKAKASNVVPFNQGSVNTLQASLDSFEVSIVHNSIQYGRAKGLLLIPICNDSSINRMKYTATFNQATPDSGFEFVLVPTQEIYTDMLKGNITLYPTSSIRTGIKQGNVYFGLKLDGQFKWNNPKLMSVQNQVISGLPGSIRNLGIKGVKMEFDFENLRLDYTNSMSSNTHQASFDIGTWSFASPQKVALNMPLTIQHIKYKTLPTQPAGAPFKELIRGALTFDVIMNLNDDIGGATKLGIAFALQKNLSTKNYKTDYKCVFIDSIQVNVDMAAVKLNGYLKIYDQDAVYGNGFKSYLMVKFPAVSVQASALVQFGSTVYQNNNTIYRYWRVEGNANFSPGLPFLPGMAFYGFGGGAYHNMKPLAATLNGKSTITFEPKKGTSGFKIMATLATYPKFESFNMDASIEGTFSSGNGLVKLNFNGDFYVAATLAKRNTAKIKGNVLVAYDFTIKEFNLLASVLVNAPPIVSVGSNQLTFYINGKENKWFFQFGRPAQMNTMKIFTATTYEYLIFGNYLTDLPNGFSTSFKQDYFAAIENYPTYSGSLTGGADQNAATGKGMALGVGVKFGDSYNLKVFEGTCRNWYVNSTLAAGAEMNLSFLEYQNCGSYSNFGINNYRIHGGIGLYAKASAGIKGNPKSNVCSQLTYDLAAFKSGVWLTGKFPNPTYLAGAVEGDVELMGNDNLTKHFYWAFTFGNDCSGTINPIAAGVEQDKANDYKNALIQYVEPSVQNNFPINAPLIVKYGFEPNAVFDVGESKADGSVVNRTFRLKINEVKLEVKTANNVYTPLVLQLFKDNMGQYQYRAKPPINTQVVFSGSNQSNNLAQTGNTLNTTGQTNFMFGSGQLMNLNLQQPPEPVLPIFPAMASAPQNNLENNKSYKFTVTVTLQEFKNGSWQNALTKTGLVVTQTKVKIFSTPSPITFNNNNGGNPR